MKILHLLVLLSLIVIGISPISPFTPIANALGNCTSAPTAQTLPATYISMTSARLNGYIVNDGNVSGVGNDTVWVRFEYYSGNGSDDTITAWVGGYRTGDYAYVNITGLTPSTTYTYTLGAWNTCGFTTGNCTGNSTGSGSGYPYLSAVDGYPAGNTTWLITAPGCTFTTAVAVNNVEDFLAIPKVSEATIDLKWQKPLGAKSVMVRFKLNSYPGNTTDGTLVALTDMNTYSHTGLTAGDTLYYSAWGISGNWTSAIPARAIATVSLTSDANTFTNPDMPTNWFSTVDFTKMSALPFYGTINEVTDSFGINKQFMWGTLGFMIALLVFIASYRATQGSVLSALLATTVILAVETGMGLMAGFMVFLFVIMAISLAFVHARA